MKFRKWWLQTQDRSRGWSQDSNTGEQQPQMKQKVDVETFCSWGRRERRDSFDKYLIWWDFRKKKKDGYMKKLWKQSKIIGNSRNKSKRLCVKGNGSTQSNCLIAHLHDSAGRLYISSKCSTVMLFNYNQYNQRKEWGRCSGGCVLIANSSFITAGHKKYLTLVNQE